LGGKPLLSKEVAVAVALAATVAGSTVLISSGVGSLLGGALAVGALGALLTEHEAGRATVFSKHPMAFLYSAKEFRIY
jgi:hypothetical protein